MFIALITGTVALTSTSSLPDNPLSSIRHPLRAIVGRRLRVRRRCRSITQRVAGLKRPAFSKKSKSQIPTSVEGVNRYARCTNQSMIYNISFAQCSICLFVICSVPAGTGNAIIFTYETHRVFSPRFQLQCTGTAFPNRFEFHFSI